jgi:protocatechuate 3,4-dioxygenase beta subunit
MSQPFVKMNRRHFLWALIATPISYALAACGRPSAETSTPGAVAQPTSAPPTQAPPAPTQLAAAEPTVQSTPPQSQVLLPTPACGDEDDDLTLAQTEGPFFTPNSPERASLLEPGMAGTRMALTGYVLATDCQPIAGALLDFWHADDAGAYDNVGYKLRGHQFADADGHYTLETIVPGLYPGRTRHFHVKVQAPNGPILTTQLYFPGEPRNESDSIYRSELLMSIQDGGDGPAAAFDFVVERA